MNIEKLLSVYKTKTITEKELKEAIKGSYEEVVEKVTQLVAGNLLQPVVAARTNGRRPALYNKYRIIRQETDYSNVIERVRLLNPRFDHQAYFNNPELYLRHIKEIEDLSSFLWRHSADLEIPMSINERSLQIWGREKLLKENFSLLNNILKFNDWTLNSLNFYETPEPFFEYIHLNSTKMNVLIIENKDTWYTLRKVMIEQNQNLLFDREIHVLLYGEGRKITRGTGKLEEYNSGMLAGSDNRYYYFGDLDYEGIAIFMDLVKENKNVDIRLCTEIYELMLSESDKIKLPKSKDYRNNNVDLVAFTSLFTAEASIKIRSILNEGRYIPQEIINYQIFTGLMRLGL